MTRRPGPLVGRCAQLAARLGAVARAAPLRGAAVWVVALFRVVAALVVVAFGVAVFLGAAALVVAAFWQDVEKRAVSAPRPREAPDREWMAAPADRTTTS